MSITGYLRPNVDILCCAYRERIENWEFGDAATPYWRLYWNCGPGAVLRTGGRDTRMTPDALVLIPAGTQFSTWSERPFSHLFLHFRAGTPYTRAIQRLHSIPLSEALRHSVDSLCARLSVPDRDSDRIALAAYSLVFDALQLLRDEDFSEARSLDPRVEHVMEILEERVSCVTPNAELAQDVNMTPNAFVRLFTREAGVSPQKYSRRQRVEEAALLLHYSDLEIANIAMKTGFLDRYHFTRVFTQLQGQSPARFRKNRE